MSKLIATTLTVKEVQRHFSQWRVQKPRGRTIPQELWDEAILLTANHKLSHVARALRLNQSDLKKRVEKALPPNEKIPKKTEQLTFVEARIEDITSEGKDEWICQVFLKRPDGMEMTMGLSKPKEQVIFGMIAQFCDGRV